MKALMVTALFLVSANVFGYELEDLRRIQHQQEAEQLRQQAIQTGRQKVPEPTSDAQGVERQENIDGKRVYETQNTSRGAMPQSLGAPSRNSVAPPGYDSQSAEQYAQKMAIQRMVDRQRGNDRMMVPGDYRQ